MLYVLYESSLPICVLMDDFSIILAQKERFGKIILIIQVGYYNFIKISGFGSEGFAQMLPQTKIMTEIIDEWAPLCRINMVLTEHDSLMNMHLYGLSFDDRKIRRMVRNSHILHLSFNLNRALKVPGR
ncbi:hypothetical protein PPE_05110 [Paenibacillus polymyxa E681]|nr:hypothetical protein PPE_05110 [Paenibacillus polymyxa E681]